ncbi:MAG TPA: hypothetical protein VK400_19305, partial [Pyrinomonadaceae bacterium]|nr:hypothetical protein [Pyrinomonadaceae bacterium]
MKRTIWGFAVALLIPAFFAPAFAQPPQQPGRCFTEEEAKKIIASINAPSTTLQAAENTKAREELLKMHAERAELNRKAVENWENNQKPGAESNRMGEAHLLGLCQIIKENGWLTNEAIGEDAVEAALSIVRNNKAFALQKEFFPVLEAAAAKGLAGKGNLAWLIDNIRLGAGQ